MQAFMKKIRDWHRPRGKSGAMGLRDRRDPDDSFIFAQVFFRYVLNSSLPWTEPAAVMIMGWFIFIGAAVGIREGYHLSFDVLLYFLPDRAKLALFTVSDVVVGLFGIGMVTFGLQLAEKKPP